MHMGDMLTAIILVGVLYARVAKTDAEWAKMSPLNEGLGINCKSLLLFFLICVAIKFAAFTDFIDPLRLLADGSEMTDVAIWMWKFTMILIFEVFLAILFSVLFDDDARHELVVFTVMVMSVVSAVLIHPVQKYMGSWMGMNSHIALWVQLGILLLICIVGVAGGRRSSDRSGYQAV
eukprot:192323_1